MHLLQFQVSGSKLLPILFFVGWTIVMTLPASNFHLALSNRVVLLSDQSESVSRRLCMHSLFSIGKGGQHFFHTYWHYNVFIKAIVIFSERQV
jgi:hypothetical protein